MADLSEQIEQAANDPASVSVDGQSVTARSTESLIKVDQYLAAKTASRTRRGGMQLTRLTTPGALDDDGRASGVNSGGPI